MSSKNGGARGDQAVAPSAPASFANYRQYQWADLPEPYATGRVEFYTNMSRAEARALDGQDGEAVLLFVLHDWNLTDPTGAPLPIAADTWDRLPATLTLAILRTWVEVRDAATNLVLPAASAATTATPPSPSPAAPPASSPSSSPSTASPATTAPSPGT